MEIISINLVFMAAFILQAANYYLYTEEGWERLKHIILASLRGGVKYWRMLLQYPFQPAHKLKGSCIHFPWMEKNGRWDLKTFDPIYWENMKNLLKILKEARITPIISVLEGAERHFNRSFAPYFQGNVQGVDAIADLRAGGKNFLALVKPLFKKVLMSLKEAGISQFLIEIGNEWSYEPAGEIGFAEAYVRPLAKFLRRLGLNSFQIVVSTAPNADYFHNLYHAALCIGTRPKYPGIVGAYHFGTQSGFWENTRSPEWGWWIDRFSNFYFSTDGAKRSSSDVLKERAFFEALFRYIKGIYKRGPIIDLFLESQPLLAWGKEKRNKTCRAVLGHEDLMRVPADYFYNLFNRLGGEITIKSDRAEEKRILSAINYLHGVFMRDKPSILHPHPKRHWFWNLFKKI